MFCCNKCGYFMQHHWKNDYDTDGYCIKNDLYVDADDECNEECRNAVENFKLIEANDL